MDCHYYEVWPCWRKYATVGAGLSFPQSDSQLTSCCLQGVVLSATTCLHASCLPAPRHASCYDDNGLNSETVSEPPQLNDFFITVAMIMLISQH